MDKFTTLTGVAAPLPIVNVDTDMIIPKQFLKTIKRTGLGKNLFDDMRYDTDGKEKPLGRDKFYVPGSLVRAKVDPASPLAWGMDEQVDVMFQSSPAFRMPESTSSTWTRSVGKTRLPKMR